MKKRLAVGVAVAFVCGGGFVAGTAHADPPSCNWGELTADSIAAGFPQGAHSSDPSGDGHGPGAVDEPRDGLANVVGKGDLEATCIVIESLLP